MYKRIIAAAAAIGLAITPVVAQARPAAGQSSQVAPTMETAVGEKLYGDGFLGNPIVLIALLAAAGIGLYFILHDDKDEPASP